MARTGSDKQTEDTDFLIEAEASEYAALLVAEEQVEAFKFAVRGTRGSHRQQAAKLPFLELHVNRMLLMARDRIFLSKNTTEEGQQLARAKALAAIKNARPQIAALMGTDTHYLTRLEDGRRYSATTEPECLESSTGALAQALKAGRARVENAERYLEAAQFAIWDFGPRYDMNADARADFGTLLAALGTRHMIAVRDLMALAAVAPDSIKSERFKKFLRRQYQRTFDKPMSIMHLLSDDGDAPSSWSDATERGLRAEILAGAETL